jgi:hypothetical protein
MMLGQKRKMFSRLCCGVTAGLEAWALPLPFTGARLGVSLSDAAPAWAPATCLRVLTEDILKVACPEGWGVRAIRDAAVASPGCLQIVLN